MPVALTGFTCIIKKMSEFLPEFLRENQHFTLEQSDKVYKPSFIDRTLAGTAGFVQAGYEQYFTAVKPGYFQKISPQAKLIALLVNIVLLGLIQEITFQVVFAILLACCYLISGIQPGWIYKRIGLLALFFGFFISIPAALNLVNPGKVVIPVFKLDHACHWWIYSIPEVTGFTKEGLFMVARFTLKVANSVALVLLIMYTTPFYKIIKALRVFKVPDLFLMVIMLTHKFIFILSKTATDTFMAMKSRWWDNKVPTGRKKLVGGRIGYIFRRSWKRYEEVYKAMVSRGFSGEMQLCYESKINNRDYLFVALGSIPGMFYLFYRLL